MHVVNLGQSDMAIEQSVIVWTVSRYQEALRPRENQDGIAFDE